MFEPFFTHDEKANLIDLMAKPQIDAQSNPLSQVTIHCNTTNTISSHNKMVRLIIINEVLETGWNHQLKVSIVWPFLFECNHQLVASVYNPSISNGSSSIENLNKFATNRLNVFKIIGNVLNRIKLRK
ncbi:hypothetical protein BLOT_010092 [Blomia tropicalis]|nr:hypothetical protein BLOT_010092 [Blomia tropicalis]